MKISEAVELTQRAVSLKPDNGYYVDSLAWALFKMGRLDAARAEIIKAATLVKDDPVIYEHLGEINMKQNLRHEAKEAWLHSLELDPSNAKLIERYKDSGFGDPTLEERVRDAKRRVSQNTSSQKLTP
jgi:Flp pilus assembly protein TadD